MFARSAHARDAQAEELPPPERAPTAALRRARAPSRFQFLAARRRARETARVRTVRPTAPAPPPRTADGHGPVAPTAAAIAAADAVEIVEAVAASRLVNATRDTTPRNTSAVRAPSELYPRSMVCPITLETFRDPVVAADGHSYERAALARWFTSRVTSPTTGARLTSRQTMPNHALRVAVDEITAVLCTDQRAPAPPPTPASSA